MRRSTHNNFKRLRDLFCDLSANSDQKINNDLSIELLSTNERSLLIENVWKLSRHSLDDLKELMNQYKCSQETMSLSKEIQIPHLLSPVIQSLPVNKYNKNKEKTADHQIRSKYVVEKMMARLLRIHRMHERWVLSMQQYPANVMNAVNP